MMRETHVSLRQGILYLEKKETSYAPLLHAAGAYLFTPSLQTEFELDGIVAPQGRVEDFALRFRYFFPGTGWTAAMGYRLFEGMEKTSSVYTSALFHYVTLHLGYAL